MDPKSIVPFFQALLVANPHPTTELEHRSAFELLVAVLLSAHSTDRGVNIATRKLFALAHTPQAMAALGAERIAECLTSVNHYHTKARYLVDTCRLLVERFGGEVPRDMESLQSLPGVGRKTALVVLNTAFGEKTVAVDTHVLRVANRTGLAPGATPLAVERRLMQRVPDAFLAHAHHALVLHGRYVCRAQLPRCWECVVARWCDYEPKTPPPA
ncbi:endonuclease III [Xylophilus sp.]|uniref:endonuclease III n=1 Tax=Xylophilus sp. TaxID=2653893 RepID=UPI0013B764FA|nr:endonuclease III [Xylophilus sp.]KAF1043684.1 MAG: Endonuclease III [Xylophilus sp.]